MKEKQSIRTAVKATLLTFGLSVLSQTLAAGLDARINTQTVVEGDTFQLTLSADKQVATPDLSPLQQDFDIVGTAKSTNFSMINGEISSTLSWTVTLTPKKAGQFTIPAIEAGALSSEPLTIKVVDAANAPKSQGASQGINLTARINGSGDKFYQFQEIPLTVRIESEQAFQQAELTPPHVDGVELMQSGADRNSQLSRNGQRIYVFERDYLLRSQADGEITLPPFTLQGRVPDSNRDPFADFNRQFDDPFFRRNSPFFRRGGKAFTKRSNSLKLDITANPNAQAGEWFLPAKSVRLTAQWQPKSPTFRQGEAVVRSIRLSALGARAEQLPKLSFDKVDGAKIYVDDDKTVMRETANGTEAVREFTLSVVPTRGGAVTLPEISVEWLNTESDETTTAVLPAETIQVEANATSTHQTAPQTAKTTQTERTTPATTATQQTSKQNTAGTPNNGQNSGKNNGQDNTDPLPSSDGVSSQKFSQNGIVIAAIAGLSVLGLLLGWLSVRRLLLRRRQLSTPLNESKPTSDKQTEQNNEQNNVKKNEQHNNEQQKALKQRLDDAIKQNNAKALYQAIVQWQNTDTQHAKASDVINQVRNRLEQALFSDTAEQQQSSLDCSAMGQSLHNEWIRLTKQSNSKTDTQTLPPLYRQSKHDD